MKYRDGIISTLVTSLQFQGALVLNKIVLALLTTSGAEPVVYTRSGAAAGAASAKAPPQPAVALSGYQQQRAANATDATYDVATPSGAELAVSATIARLEERASQLQAALAATAAAQTLGRTESPCSVNVRNEQKFIRV